MIATELLLCLFVQAVVLLLLYVDSIILLDDSVICGFIHVWMINVTVF